MEYTLSTPLPVLLLYSSFFTAISSHVWEGYGGMVLEGCMETESEMAVKPGCVEEVL